MGCTVSIPDPGESWIVEDIPSLAQLPILESMLVVTTSIYFHAVIEKLSRLISFSVSVTDASFVFNKYGDVYTYYPVKRLWNLGACMLCYIAIDNVFHPSIYGNWLPVLNDIPIQLMPKITQIRVAINCEELLTNIRGATYNLIPAIDATPPEVAITLITATPELLAAYLYQEKVKRIINIEKQD